MGSPAKKLVVLGAVGTNLDRGGADRWERWRPTVDLCRHDDLVIHRLDLFCQKKFGPVVHTVVADIRSVSPETEVRTHDVEIDDPWDFELVYGALHDFARAYRFAPEREDYLVHMTTGTHVVQICLFLLAESRHFPARLIQTSPPVRGDKSGPGTYTIIDLDLSKYDRLASRFQRQRSESLSFLKSGIETRNRAFNTLIDRIEHVAIASKAPLLLMGPTGAGKSQLARRIYELKQQRGQVSGSFVEVNCATLRGDGAMSSLFGHVRGAFTGAVRDRPGLLRTADAGVLFLDEIAELGADEQAMLLRALEEGRFLPVGADHEAQSDFQLIAGTNRDLAAAVRKGAFRDDLLARINLWTFTLPGLRERAEDIGPNLEFELEECSHRIGTRITFNQEARDQFLRFATSSQAIWSGNFRDFNAAVLRMGTLAPGGRIDVATVRDEIARLTSAWQGAGGDEGSTPDLLAQLLDRDAIARLDRFDRIQLLDVLRVCVTAATLSEAGRVLFAASRGRKSSSNDADRLRKYLARFGLSWQAVRERATRHPG